MIPDKPVWWWWKHCDTGEPLPVLLRETDGPPRDWLICILREARRWHCGLSVHHTSRTVASMGGVWLGPVEPPERKD